MLALIYVVIALLALALFLYRKHFHRPCDMTGRTVVITGGSSGVGLALAQQCLHRGASHLVLIARDKKRLNDAVESLKVTATQKVTTISADVSNWEQTRQAFEQISAVTERIDFLFANAGIARPAMFEDMTEESLRSQLDVNLIGAISATKHALPMLKPGSHVVYSGSACSICSFAGFSGYAPTKYALRGFAEALRNELQPRGITVHLGILSTVDTPGLVLENKCKPEVCKAIEGTASVFSPEEVAGRLLEGIDNGNFVITMEPLIWFLMESSAGLIPSNNMFLSLLAAPVLPIFRFCLRHYIDWIARGQLKIKRE